MPLYVRKSTDHYPDRDAPLFTAETAHVVLCGNLVVGSISRTSHGPSEGVWQWGTGFGDGLSAGATAETFEVCKERLAAAFREILARAGLAERADAKGGPPVSGTRANPPELVWNGTEKTLEEARTSHAACWAEWLGWAGLEQQEPIRWRSAWVDRNPVSWATLTRDNCEWSSVVASDVELAEITRATQSNAWAALSMIRETVETVGPPGILPSCEALRDPTSRAGVPGLIFCAG